MRIIRTHWTVGRKLAALSVLGLLVAAVVGTVAYQAMGQVNAARHTPPSSVAA
jgi:hypothetical protein